MKLALAIALMLGLTVVVAAQNTINFWGVMGGPGKVGGGAPGVITPPPPPPTCTGALDLSEGCALTILVVGF